MSLAVSARSAQLPVFIIKVVVVSFAARMSGGVFLVYILIIVLVVIIKFLSLIIVLLYLLVFRGVKTLIVFLIVIGRRIDVALSRSLDLFLKGLSLCLRKGLQLSLSCHRLVGDWLCRLLMRGLLTTTLGTHQARRGASYTCTDESVILLIFGVVASVCTLRVASSAGCNLGRLML